MELHIENSGTFTEAKITGALSASDAEELVEELADAATGEGAQLALDLSGLSSIDSGGLSALIHLVTRSRLSNGRVILVAPSPFVHGVFGVTRLDGWFDIRETLADAKREFAQA